MIDQIVNPLTGKFINARGKTAKKLYKMHCQKEIKLNKQTLQTLKQIQKGGKPIDGDDDKILQPYQKKQRTDNPADWENIHECNYIIQKEHLFQKVDIFIEKLERLKNDRDNTLLIDDISNDVKLYVCHAGVKSETRDAYNTVLNVITDLDFKLKTAIMGRFFQKVNPSNPSTIDTHSQIFRRLYLGEPPPVRYEFTNEYGKTKVLEDEIAFLHTFCYDTNYYHVGLHDNLLCEIFRYEYAEEGQGYVLLETPHIRPIKARVINDEEGADDPDMYYPIHGELFSSIVNNYRYRLLKQLLTPEHFSLKKFKRDSNSIVSNTYYFWKLISLYPRKPGPQQKLTLHQIFRDIYGIFLGSFDDNLLPRSKLQLFKSNPDQTEIVKYYSLKYQMIFRPLYAPYEYLPISIDRPESIAGAISFHNFTDEIIALHDNINARCKPGEMPSDIGALKTLDNIGNVSIPFYSSRENAMIDYIIKFSKQLQLNPMPPVIWNENHLYNIKTQKDYHERELHFPFVVDTELLNQLRDILQENEHSYYEYINNQKGFIFPSLLDRFFKRFSDGDIFITNKVIEMVIKACRPLKSIKDAIELVSSIDDELMYLLYHHDEHFHH